MTESHIASITKALGRIEKHLDRQDDRFDTCDGRFNGIDGRLNTLSETIQGVGEHLDTHVSGPGTKKTAVTGGGAGALVTAVVLAIFEGLKRLHV